MRFPQKCLYNCSILKKLKLSLTALKKLTDQLPIVLIALDVRASTVEV